MVPEGVGHRKHILVDNDQENQPVVSGGQSVVSGQPLDISTPAKHGLTSNTSTPVRATPASSNEETLLEKDELIVKTVSIYMCFKLF